MQTVKAKTYTTTDLTCAGYLLYMGHELEGTTVIQTGPNRTSIGWLFDAAETEHDVADYSEGLGSAEPRELSSIIGQLKRAMYKELDAVKQGS